MRHIFLNEELEKEISAQGYAIVKDFADDKVCNELSSFFEQNDLSDDRAFTISNWHNDIEYRTKTYNKIVDQLIDTAGSYLDRYKPVMAVYTSKKPGAESSMLLHQDWSLVDETKYRSVSIWLALCDMDRANGNLQVAARSHIYAGGPRGMNMPIPFESIRSYMHEHALTDIAIRKGDAVIFDHRLIHASPENNSNKIRLAAVMALVPAEAELIHYYKDQANDHELEILKMDEKDFFLIDFFDMPNKPKHVSTIAKVPASFRQLTTDEIEKAK